MKKIIYILPILFAILFVRCDENEHISRPVIAFWSRIYFEDQRINDSIAGLKKNIDYYSIFEVSDVYTAGDTILAKIPKPFLYTIDCSFDNGAEKMRGSAFSRFDTDESTGKSYIILASSMDLPIKHEGMHDVIYKLYCPSIFGDEEIHNITIKVSDLLWGDYTSTGLIPIKEFYFDGKKGEILDPELNIVEFKVFGD